MTGSLSDAVSFAFYARLVKNLRAVLLFDPIDPSYRSRIDWLSRRFHYRNLGVPPSLYSEEEFGGKKRGVFRKLYFPVEELRGLADLFVDAGYPNYFVEAFVLASTYISPLLLVSRRFLGLVEENSLGVVRTCRGLDVKDWKLHMRIADYSITDFYEDMVSYAAEYLESIEDPAARKRIIEKRRRIIEKDIKRYWRITCEGEGNVFLYYLDPLLIVEDRINSIKEALRPEHIPGISVVPTVNLLLDEN